MRLKFLVVFLFLVACGGADEANISGEQFVEDFGTPLIEFNLNGCNTSLTVGTIDNSQVGVWTIRTLEGFIIALHGVDRDVVKNVGIIYQSEDHDFSILKYFDGQIIMKYDDVECQKSTFLNDI